MTNPKTIGKYEIIKEIGRGSFGVVYQASDTRLGRPVALKVLHPSHSDPTFIDRFEREARIAAQFNHPHIVTIHEVGEEQGHHFLAMEYLDGQSLAQRLKRGPLPRERVLQLLAQIAAALDTIHQAGLTHRDVKPSNIMLAANDRAVLLDFGLVQAADGTKLTASGASLGTFEYIAPEQIEHQGELDGRADIYALGVVAYELLVGQLPFSGSMASLINQHLNIAPPLPTAVNSDLPAEFDPSLLKALAKAPDDRYPTAGAFAAKLNITYQKIRHNAKLEALYEQLTAAHKSHDWSEVLSLAEQIKILSPQYRDVQQLMTDAHQGLQTHRSSLNSRSDHSSQVKPTSRPLRWFWVVGLGLLSLGCLTCLGLGAFFNNDSTLSPSATLNSEILSSPTSTSSIALTIEPTITPFQSQNASSPEISLTMDPDRTDLVGPTIASSAPTWLRVESVGIDSQIVPVGWSVVIRDGQEYSIWDVADDAVGWHKTTALLGQPGNTVLTGYNNINGEVFRDLVDVKIGDKLTVWSVEKRFDYVVDFKTIVKEKGEPLEVKRKNALWIAPTSDERLTLITSWPYTNNTHRVIVVAKPSKNIE